jgi:hypothetical protein
MLLASRLISDLVCYAIRIHSSLVDGHARKKMIAYRHIQVLVSITVLGKGHSNKPRIRIQYSHYTIMLILHPRSPTISWNILFKPSWVTYVGSSYH